MTAAQIATALLEDGFNFSPEAEQEIWAELFPPSFGLADEFPFDPQGIKRLLAGLDERSLTALWYRYEKRSTYAATGALIPSMRKHGKFLSRELA